jgi:hypothetical protein
MTEPKKVFEAAEEHVEDLEAPASQQENVAGGQRCLETICEMTPETTIIIG